jgi:hypothetical protein
MPAPLVPVVGGTGGGTQLMPPSAPVEPTQPHWHGGHIWPGAQAGQEQLQPPGGGGGALCPHTPEGQVLPGTQGTVVANHWQVISATQLVWSVCALQGSGAIMPPMLGSVDGLGGGAGTGPPEPQPQLHDGQL